MHNSQRLVSPMDFHKLIVGVLLGKEDSDFSDDEIEEYNLHH